MLRVNTICEYGILYFRGTYVEYPPAAPVGSRARPWHNWAAWPGHRPAFRTDSCAWDYVLVHTHTSDSHPRIYGLPRENAAPMCLELHAHARVDVWHAVSEDETAWYMEIQGIDGAGHCLEWILRMYDEVHHIHRCCYAIRVRVCYSPRIVYGASHASSPPDFYMHLDRPLQRGRSRKQQCSIWQCHHTFCTC